MFKTHRPAEIGAEKHSFFGGLERAVPRGIAGYFGMTGTQIAWRL
ncbi:MAG: hypothetical protein RR287_00975 [Oscillospiraceae bacterium]